MLNTLEKLCSLSGVSGDERAVCSFIKKEAAQYASKISEDVMGNLTVFVKGKKRREKPLMLAAHMDEVGICITGFTSDGLLRFAFAGGVDRRVVIGKQVLIGKKEIPGIIGIKAVHMTTKEEREKTPKLSELLIDIGCETEAAAKKLVALGDSAVFAGSFIRLGKHKVKSRAIDDRFGCAVLLELMKKPLLYDTYFVFTAQEEVGCRGAGAAAYAIKPALALVVESTTAADLPGSEEHTKVASLGKGAVIGCVDGATIFDKDLFALLRKTASDENIPWQIKTKIAGGTDSKSIQLSREGVRVASLSLPTRYIHSPSCVADIRDMQSVLALAEKFINTEESAL